MDDTPLDEMRLVRDLLAEGRPPTRQDVAMARHLVLEATRRSGVRQSVFRSAAGTWLRYRRACMGLAAAAAALAVAATTGGPQLFGRDPGEPPTGTISAGTGPTTLSARRILLTAATAALRDDSSGAYWRVRARNGSHAMTDRGYVVDHVYSEEQWVPRSAEQPTWQITQDLGSRPATAPDEAAWRADGSPESWLIPPKKLTAEEQRMYRKKLALNHGRLKPPTGERLTIVGTAPEVRREDRHGSAGYLAGRSWTFSWPHCPQNPNACSPSSARNSPPRTRL
ncbi:hypothetical protein ACWDSD_34875 [Streptomyces spiralis]